MLLPATLLGASLDPWGNTITAPVFNTSLTLTNDTAAQGVNLYVTAANTLAMYNGANGQGIQLYNTRTDASNYERLTLGWNASTAYLWTESAGTGNNRNLVVAGKSALFFGIGSTPSLYWEVANSGSFIPFNDNATDAGASGNKIRSVYVGTSILLGTNVLSFTGTNLTWNGTTITVP